ncbi:MAG TPA: hypothetical protein DIC59_03430 [Candidatus Competibacteraceae bacterium]|nr:hypothetical protein [Candidatus Competibacteraceae bacterium]
MSSILNDTPPTGRFTAQLTPEFLAELPPDEAAVICRLAPLLDRLNPKQVREAVCIMELMGRCNQLGVYEKPHVNNKMNRLFQKLRASRHHAVKCHYRNRIFQFLNRQICKAVPTEASR